jgi:hypothetical protein
MKSIITLKKILIVSLSVLFALSACSDDSTSADDNGNGCNISLPSSFLHVQADVSYFQEQDIPNEEEYSVYKQVEQIATLGASLLASGGALEIAAGVLAFAHSLNIQPEFKDGACVWEITIPEGFVEEGSPTITVFGTPANNGVNWEIKATGLIFGEEVEDQTIITGFAASDEQSGEWNLYDPEMGTTPAVTYTWNIDSEDIYQMNFNAEGEAAVDYARNGAENDMSFESPGMVMSIHWNTETDSGWLIDESGMQCFYEDFVNAGCS